MNPIEEKTGARHLAVRELLERICGYKQAGGKPRRDTKPCRWEMVMIRGIMGPGEEGMPRRREMKEAGRPCRKTGRKKRRLGRINHQNGEEGEEEGNKKSKKGNNGGENFEGEGGGPSYGRVHTDSSWQGDRSTGSGVVTVYRGDDERYAVSIG